MKSLILFATIASIAAAQPRSAVAPFISVNEPVVALVHVRVIDGTGAPVAEDQTIVIDRGKIAAVRRALLRRRFQRERDAWTSRVTR